MLVAGPELVRRYEDLRAGVLGGPDGGSRHGWAVLVRSGMAAWLVAVARIPGCGQRDRVRPGQHSGLASGQPNGELVQVLATMVFAAASGCRSG